MKKGHQLRWPFKNKKPYYFNTHTKLTVFIKMTSMEQTHTPGVWRVDINASNEKAPSISIYASGAGHIASILRFNPYPIPESEYYANAKLMAAAPDLLEALVELRTWVCALNDWSGGTTLDPDIEKVDAAIKKATEF